MLHPCKGLFHVADCRSCCARLPNHIADLISYPHTLLRTQNMVLFWFAKNGPRGEQHTCVVSCPSVARLVIACAARNRSPPYRYVATQLAARGVVSGDASFVMATRRRDVFDQKRIGDNLCPFVMKMDLDTKSMGQSRCVGMSSTSGDREGRTK